MGGLGVLKGLVGSLGGLSTILPVVAGALLVIAAIVTNAGGAGDAFSGLTDCLGLLGGQIVSLIESLATGLVPILEILVGLVGTILAASIDDTTQSVLGLTSCMEPLKKICQDVISVFNDLIALYTGPFHAAGNQFDLDMERMNVGVSVVLDPLRTLLDIISKLTDKIAEGLNDLREFLAALGLVAAKETSAFDFTKSFEEQAKIRAGVKYGKTASTMWTMSMTDMFIARQKAETDRRIAENKARTAHVQHTTNLNLDGRRVHQSVSRQEVEVTERMGAKITPWQRRTILEHGSTLLNAAY
jgi:hypothetical protein